MYRGVAGDPLSSPFLTAQPVASTPWIDLLFPLLLLLALALMISSASTGVAALDTISPSSSAPQQPAAYTPTHRVQLQETVRASAPSQSNGSASNSNANDSPPSYGFNRGFDKPYQKMTILIAVLLIATLLIGFCTHYVTLQSCRVRREGEGDAEAQGGGQGASEGGGRGGGLDPWIVRSLPTVRYSATNRMKEEEEGEAGEGKKGGEAMAMAMAMVKQECAVCLSEFEEGEEMKALPECGHAFHSACIDMWLFSHTTCPICRLSLLKSRSSSKRKPAAASRSPSRGDRLHVAVTVQQSADPTMSASTSTGPRHVTPTWPAHLDDDVAEDARDSSAALYPHLPSS